MTLIQHGCAFVNMKMEHLRSLGLKWISHVNEIETGNKMQFSLKISSQPTALLDPLGPSPK